VLWLKRSPHRCVRVGPVSFWRANACSAQGAVAAGKGGDATRYQLQEQVSLFGCNNGFIPWLLSLKVPPGQGEPYAWHVDVVNELGAHPDYSASTLIIDLKPKQNKRNLSLYEVLDVWGYASWNWSPILLRLSGLFVDAAPARINRRSFVRKDAGVDSPIYEFLYLVGSVKRGKLVGPWTTPPASPTNAALLWPDTLRYSFRKGGGLVDAKGEYRHCAPFRSDRRDRPCDPVTRRRVIVDRHRVGGAADDEAA
jgi:hypothetical protein